MRATASAASCVALALALTGGAGTAAAKTPRVPCPGGRFVVQGGPLLPGAPADEVDVIEVRPGTGTLSVGCSAADLTRPVVLKATKKFTRVKAAWRGCAHVSRTVRLARGRIVDDCGTLTGKLRAPHVKRTFTALLSTCGDGFVDTGGGEECDVGHACAEGACSSDCRCSGSTTTTNPSTSTSTTLPGSCTTGPLLYSNLGAGQAYGTDYDFVQVAGGTPGKSVYYIGTRFTAAASGTLSEVCVPVANSQGTETFALYADPAGAPSKTGFSGDPLERWTGVAVPVPDATVPVPSIPLTMLTSQSHPQMTAGTTYWFWVSSAQTGIALCCPAGLPPSICTPKPGDPYCPPAGLFPTLGSFWSDALTGTGGFWGGPFATGPSSSSSPPPAISVVGTP